jgi:hypothetical protein
MRSRWCSLVERIYDLDIRILLHDMHHRPSLGMLLGRFEPASRCNEFAVKCQRRGVAPSSSLTSNPHLVRLSQTSSTIGSHN